MFTRSLRLRMALEGSKILFREREELGEASERGAVEYLMRKTVCIAQLLENFRFQRLR
ncbi:MAG: hypothetical protein QXU47_05675 [Candidatus Bathyarchaeia archaeon]